VGVPFSPRQLLVIFTQHFPRRFPEKSGAARRWKLEVRGWNLEIIGERISLAICIYQRRQSAIAIMTRAFAGDDE